MVVVCDDEDRENEGDLTMAAQFATPEAINFMAKHGRGLICLALTGERCDELGLDLMAAKNESPFQTAFTVSIEAREGITTGISAPDRSRTIQVAVDPSSKPTDLVQPGHVFPLRASDRLGGHIVQGHVDGLGEVRDVREDGFARIVTVGAAPGLLRYVVEKGSIAVDGVSLTVAALDERGFEVSLIPETLERTTLGSAAPGRQVNVEVDVLAKYVEKLAAVNR